MEPITLKEFENGVTLNLQPEIKTEWKYEYQYKWIFAECQQLTILVTATIAITIIFKIILGFFRRRKNKENKWMLETHAGNEWRALDADIQRLPISQTKKDELTEMVFDVINAHIVASKNEQS